MYQEKCKTISLSSFISGRFVKFITPYVKLRNEKLKHYDKKVGDIIDIRDKQYKILIVKMQTQKINNHQHRRKVLFYLECIKCGYRFWRSSNQLDNLSCENCNHMVVMQGVNDISTTDPWMIKYFKGGIDEARKYRIESRKKITPICPYCKRVLNDIQINRLYTQHGVFCPYCSDKITFPEKFMASLLRQLNIDYIREANKELPFDAKKRLYDFYIKEKSCIIETHGIQHYDETSFPQSLMEQQEIDNHKRIIAINGGIENYVVIDCRVSTLEWIKTSIMKSQLPLLFSFSENDIDWDQCYIDACSSIKKRIWDYYNKHYPTTKELSALFKIHPQTINNYLKQGNDLGLIKYNGKLEMYSDPIDVYYCGTLFFTGMNCPDVSHKLKELTGIDKSKQAIQRYVSGTQSLTNYSFKRVVDRERRRGIIYGNT